MFGAVFYLDDFIIRLFELTVIGDFEESKLDYWKF